MNRRIVLATCLAGFIAASAGAALATPSPGQNKKNDVCIAIAQNDNYHSADYYCIDINEP